MQMAMIFADMPTQNRYVAPFACLSDQFPGTQDYFARQNLIPVLCHPNEMVLDAIDCVWPLLYPSPMG
jgi:hypothetical protein